MNDIQIRERNEIIIEKKKQRQSYNSSSNDDIFLIYGGLLIVDSPYHANYNDVAFLSLLSEGLHDGISVLNDVSFGDLIDVGEGAMGAFSNVDWPDLDFAEFGSEVGELAGNAAEFAGVLGSGVVDVAGDAIEFVGGAQQAHFTHPKVF